MASARFAAALAAAICAWPTLSPAQLHKCKGPDGKIVYSDQRCDAAAAPAALAPGVSNRAHQIEEKAAADKAAAEKAAEERRLNAEARVNAERKAAGLPPLEPGTPLPPGSMPAESTSTPSGPPGRYQLTASDRERIANLEADAGRQGASAERKTAALLEISSIRSGRDAKLPADVRARRDSLMTDLSSTDAARRREALNQLRSLYSNY